MLACLGMCLSFCLCVGCVKLCIVANVCFVVLYLSLLYVCVPNDCVLRMCGVCVFVCFPARVRMCVWMCLHCLSVL